MRVGFDFFWFFFALIHHFNALYFFLDWKCGGLSRLSHLTWRLIWSVKNVGWIILPFRPWQFEVLLSEFSGVLLLFGLGLIILSRSIEIKLRHRLVSADTLLRHMVFLIKIQIWVVRALSCLKQGWVFYGLSQITHFPYSRWLFWSFAWKNLNFSYWHLLFSAEIPVRHLILANEHNFFFILPLSRMRSWVLLLKLDLVIPPNALSILLLLSWNLSSFEAINYKSYDNHKQNPSEQR